MKALVTGASSGIGREFVKILSENGYDIIAVARRGNRLEELRKEIKTNLTAVTLDLSKEENCISLYEQFKNEDIEVVINDAGFGLLGEFEKSSADVEMKMIDVNCKAVHILMKLFLQKFFKENRGYILNVCSIGGFMPGPLMATYYATKAYVLSLTRAVYEEIRRNGKNVYIGCICPGPVATEFGVVANVRFSIKSRTPREVALYGVKKMFGRKLIILPGAEIKAAAFFSRFVPPKLLAKICYNIQHKKSDMDFKKF